MESLWNDFQLEIRSLVITHITPRDAAVRNVALSMNDKGPKVSLFKNLGVRGINFP